jgi:predicted nuclease of predicted toxin-antitoxin system
MRILLDECIPQRLGRDLLGHEIGTVRQMGWAGLKNGALLTKATGHFDVFLTVDKNLPKQQQLSAYAIAVVVLRCATNDINDLKKLVPQLLVALPKASKGRALLIG